MEDYRKFLRFLQGHVGLLTLAFFCILISTLFEGFTFSLVIPVADKILGDGAVVLPGNVPAFIVRIIDKVNATPRLTLLYTVSIIAVSILILKHFFIFWKGYLMNDVSQRVTRDIRDRIYKKIQNLSLEYFSKKRGGELISRITNDVQMVDNAVSYGVTDLITQSITIVMFTTFLFVIHFKLAMIVFVLFPLIALPMVQIGKKLRKLSKSSQEKMADINSLLIETISGVRVVKAFSMEDYEVGRFAKQNRDIYKLKMKSVRRLLIISPITEIIGVLMGVGILAWLGRQVIAGEFSFGIFAFFFGSLMQLISPIKKLSNVHAITQQALAASNRIYDILDTKTTVAEKPNARELVSFTKNIQIEHVSFQYDEESGGVLKDISLDITVGDIVALVGPTGTGKSTLANLVPRFYDPTKGRVLIDGIDLKDLTLKSLRSQIGIVTQETILFNDTVRSNIAYGHQEASLAGIQEAAQRAFAHDFIMKLPQQYDTVIGDRGFRLSGGEKQRIAIARAILKNPPLLILDEATSQLDSESERFVQEALDDLMTGRTVICIAHRLSTIKKATKIAVIDGGAIVGLDHHDALLKTCPLYQRLYQMQFTM